VGRSDWLVLGLIALRNAYGVATLPLLAAFVATQPLLMELLTGSSVAQVVVGARVRVGEVSWPVAVLAGLPAWVLFDWLYWWVGRRWGDRALVMLLTRGGRSDAVAQAARAERAVARLGPAAVVLAFFLPVPTVLVYAAAGTAGMRLRTFVPLNVLGRSLAVTLVVGLGYALGRRGLDIVERFDDAAFVVTVVALVLLGLVQAWRMVRARRRRRSA
jgi:membrane protein DedA with SNARE-associated domain